MPSWPLFSAAMGMPSSRETSENKSFSSESAPLASGRLSAGLGAAWNGRNVGPGCVFWRASVLSMDCCSRAIIISSASCICTSPSVGPVGLNVFLRWIRWNMSSATLSSSSTANATSFASSAIASECLPCASSSRACCWAVVRLFCLARRFSCVSLRLSPRRSASSAAWCTSSASSSASSSATFCANTFIASSFRPCSMSSWACC
mmetsp:Transcript_52940/g.123961  ORF Transcript_52940/g.123961 Transcript_52940/m.123961 type:complete len:205 (+) Transcript_52940:804-1418(+)